MTLVEFLLARIAEDEDTANAAINARKNPRREDGSPHWTVGAGGRAIHDGGIPPSPARGAHVVMAHIARHDPARVLDECESKRRIVERAQAALSIYDPSDPTAWIALYDLADLAKVYADHPDYGAVVGPPESAIDVLAVGAPCETCRATPARDRDIPGLRPLRLCDACAKEYGAR